MTDMLYLIGAAAWILGLAEMLAASSIWYFLTSSSGQTFRPSMRNPLFQRAILGGLVLFAFGLVLSAGQWWERGGWAGVMAIAGWEWFKVWHDHRSDSGIGE